MVEVKTREPQRTVVTGKTSVPFKTFVALVLQKKVLTLFKNWGDSQVILDSELLTKIASAPQDSQEDRSKLVLVTLGIGMLCGVFFLAIFQIGLLSLGIQLAQRELLIIAGLLVGLCLLTAVLIRTQRKSRAQKIAEAMEKVASLLSK